MRTNLISPKDAITTPITMNETLNRTFILGEPAPRAQVARRTATGMVAYRFCQFLRSELLDEPYLQHLNKGHTQVQIRHIAADQTQAEEYANWDDGSQEDSSSHFHGLSAIKKCGGPGKNLGHERGEGKMPCCKDDSYGSNSCQRRAYPRFGVSQEVRTEI